MQIETVSEASFMEVLPLIAAYQEFYKRTPDPERNHQFFAQFINNHTNGIQFLARGETGKALGFATLFFPYSSTRAAQYCLMNDLFTVPDARGQGIGRALIQHCLGYAATRGYPAISWQTAQSNTTAQRLYDRTGASQSAWYTYELRG